jgi:dephospho-CoA kinase
MCTERPPDDAARRRRTPIEQRDAASSTSSRGRRARPRGAAPFVLGIVGPAGSGKSTLARSLAGPRTRVLDADRFGHEITDGDAAVRAALAAEYGADVYRADGTLDRARVGARVFSDPAALARLNALVHPRIVQRLREGVAAAGGADTVVVDAALLLDWGFERECDAVLAVTAPLETQVRRLVQGRGWSEADARQRLAAARSDEAFASLADEVLVNDRSEPELADAARAALARLLARRAGARS